MTKVSAKRHNQRNFTTKEKITDKGQWKCYFWIFLFHYCLSTYILSQRNLWRIYNLLYSYRKKYISSRAVYFYLCWFIQLEPCSKFYIRILHKLNVNGVTLTRQNLLLKCCKSFEQKLCYQPVQDLFKEVFWVYVGQRAAKLSDVKLWGWSNRLGLKLGPHASRACWAERQNSILSL